MLKFFVSAVLFATTASGALAGSSIETARGSVDIQGIPKTIVAIDPTAIDTLQALGVELSGIPGQQLLKYVKAQGTTPVGTLFEPDLEAISALAPDLIIVGDRSAKSYDAVARIAPTIDMTMSSDLINDARSRLDTYGEVFDKQTKAAELKADLDRRLAELRKAAAGKGSALVVMSNGPKMSAYGKGSRFGWIYDATGMAEAAVGLPISLHGATITQEFIAEKNPDWIFVLDRASAIHSGEQPAWETLDTPLVRTTNAWTSGHVVYLPAAEMYVGWGGQQALVAVVNSLTDALSK
jgi:iron complex transport system substrate-binding protein